MSVLRPPATDHGGKAVICGKKKSRGKGPPGKREEEMEGGGRTEKSGRVGKKSFSFPLMTFLPFLAIGRERRKDGANKPTRLTDPFYIIDPFCDCTVL